MSILDSVIYQIITESIKTNVPNTFTIEKEKEALLGIDFTTETTPVTKDGRISLPVFMIAKIKPGSIAQKSGLKIGSVITELNGLPLTIDKYHEEIVKHTSFSLTLDESFCGLYQFLISDPTLSERITFHKN